MMINYDKLWDGCWKTIQESEDGHDGYQCDISN